MTRFPGLLLLLPAAALAASATDLSTPADQRVLEDAIRSAVTNPAALKSTEQVLIREFGGTNVAAALFAAQQLGTIGTEAAVQALAAKLTVPEFAHAACVALAKNPSPRAGEALVQALPKATGATRLQILHALGTRGETRAVSAIAKLASGTDAETAEAAAAALARIPGRDARKALDALPGFHAAKLERAERDGDAKAAERLTAPGLPVPVRRGALALQLKLDPDRAARRITAIARSGDAILTPVALAAVEHLPGRLVSGEFAALLPELEPTAQAWLVAALAGRGDTGAREAIRTAIRSPHENVRIAAYDAARRLGDVASVPGMLVSLERAGDAEAKRIEDVLLALPAGPGLNAALLVSLDMTGPGRARLIGIVAKRKVPGAAAELLKSLPTLDAASAKSALQAVGQVGTVAELPALLAAVGVQDGAEPAAARLLGRIEDGAARTAALREALAKATTTEVRSALIRLLPKAGTAEALQDVNARLQDGDAALRSEAVRALAAWPDVAAWDALVKLYTGETDDTSRALALRGLVRIAGTSSENAARLGPLFAVARSDDDRRQLLGAAATSGNQALLPFIEPLLTNEALKNEAQAARAALTKP